MWSDSLFWPPVLSSCTHFQCSTKFQSEWKREATAKISAIIHFSTVPSYRIIEPSGPFLWRKSNFRLTFQQLPKSLSSYLRKLSKRVRLWRRNVWQRRIHPLKGNNPSQKPINLAPIYTVVNQPLLTWNPDKDRFGPAFNNFWQTAFECVELKRKFISFLANNAYLATSGM